MLILVTLFAIPYRVETKVDPAFYETLAGLYLGALRNELLTAGF